MNRLRALWLALMIWHPVNVWRAKRSPDPGAIYDPFDLIDLRTALAVGAIVWLK